MPCAGRAAFFPACRSGEGWGVPVPEKTCRSGPYPESGVCGEALSAPLGYDESSLQQDLQQLLDRQADDIGMGTIDFGG